MILISVFFHRRCLIEAFQTLYLPIPGMGVGSAILHTPTNIWTIGGTELKFYMLIEIHKFFPKIEKQLGWKF